jgi:hypothetical protein
MVHQRNVIKIGVAETYFFFIDKKTPSLDPEKDKQTSFLQPVLL